MTDRELLELAAKAAGYEIMTIKFRRDEFAMKHSSGVYVRWMPLDDDGDALRLAVKLGLNVICDAIGSVTVRKESPKAFVQLGASDPYAATRRAIVRAAAEIGKGME